MIEYQEPVEQTETMKEGLAHLYADKGVREYVENIIRADMKLLVDEVAKQNWEGATYFVARIKCYNKLLEQGKNWYKHYGTKKK